MKRKTKRIIAGVLSCLIIAVYVTTSIVAYLV